MFRDRIEAGRCLAAALKGCSTAHPLVLAIPRGAVPMGKVLADALDGDLDVVLVRKIGAPFQAELAVAAIDESGWIYRNPGFGDDPGLQDYIAEEGAVQLDNIRRRRARYTPERNALDPRGRTVIVVDDGLATGATMITALHSLRDKQPARLICAVPVAPAETLAKIRPYADEVVCLETPAFFEAVGQFYADFTQVEDEQVVATLRAAELRPDEPLQRIKEMP
ncbi:MAG: phosphoribosyltransferase [Rhodocyclales bacterium]|nr:phosphoribosyltransferase [Rhodocyclales bacterium]